MTAEITANNNDSLTIKYVTKEQLQTFNLIFGDPLANIKNLVNPNNLQYKKDPVVINNKEYAYSVYDSENYGEDLYTIVLQRKK